MTETKDYPEGRADTDDGDPAVMNCGRYSYRIDAVFEWPARLLACVGYWLQYASVELRAWAAREGHVTIVHEQWTEPAPTLEEFKAAIGSMMDETDFLYAEEDGELTRMTRQKAVDMLPYVGIVQAVDDE